MPDWTDEIKAQVIKDYKASNPTPETTTEIVKGIADELGDEYTANGVRAILTKAGVYLRKTPATSSGNGTSTTRVSKADSINELANLIEAAGLEVDMDIVGKLTGKAAIYFKTVFEKLSEKD